MEWGVAKYSILLYQLALSFIASFSSIINILTQQYLYYAQIAIFTSQMQGVFS